MEKLPRISRAQSMDVLSSQANIAGYKAVLVAANVYQKFFPMLMRWVGEMYCGLFGLAYQEEENRLIHLRY
jgi:NAD/NADP transhydrogenase alpha subunit